MHHVSVSGYERLAVQQTVKLSKPPFCSSDSTLHLSIVVFSKQYYQLLPLWEKSLLETVLHNLFTYINNHIHIKDLHALNLAKTKFLRIGLTKKNVRRNQSWSVKFVSLNFWNKERNKQTIEILNRLYTGLINCLVLTKPLWRNTTSSRIIP